MAEDMSLLEELDADQGSQGGTCSTSLILSRMDEADRAQWEAAMRNPAYTAASIFRASERRGLGFSEQSVQRHVRRLRNGQGCLCPR